VELTRDGRGKRGGTVVQSQEEKGITRDIKTRVEYRGERQEERAGTGWKKFFRFAFLECFDVSQDVS
jgi:hypothetical protein